MDGMVIEPCVDGYAGQYSHGDAQQADVKCFYEKDPGEQRFLHPHRDHHRQFPFPFREHHDDRAQDTEADDQVKDGFHDLASRAVAFDHLDQLGLHLFPVHHPVGRTDEGLQGLIGGRHIVMIFYHEHQRGDPARGRKEILGQGQVHVDELFIELGQGIFENAGDRIFAGRVDAVISHAQEHQRVAHVQMQVFGQIIAHQHPPVAGVNVSAPDDPFPGVGDPVLRLRIDTDDDPSFGQTFGGGQGERLQPRRDPGDLPDAAHLLQQAVGKRKGVVDGLVLPVILLLDLKVSGVELHHIVDHLAVAALLHGGHDRREDDPEEDRGGRDERPAFVSPDISPGDDIQVHDGGLLKNGC